MGSSVRLEQNKKTQSVYLGFKLISLIKDQTHEVVSFKTKYNNNNIYLAATLIFKIIVFKNLHFLN